MNLVRKPKNKLGKGVQFMAVEVNSNKANLKEGTYLITEPAEISMRTDKGVKV